MNFQNSNSRHRDYNNRRQNISNDRSRDRGRKFNKIRSNSSRRHSGKRRDRSQEGNFYSVNKSRRDNDKRNRSTSTDYQSRRDFSGRPKQRGKVYCKSNHSQVDFGYPQNYQVSRMNEDIAKRMPLEREQQGAGYKVYVTNLAFATDWRSLKDHMKKCGFVVRADIFEDDKGRSKGTGVVEFRNQNDAIRAIREVNSTQLDGRTVYVKEYHEQGSRSRAQQSINLPQDGRYNIRDGRYNIRDGRDGYQKSMDFIPLNRNQRSRSRSNPKRFNPQNRFDGRDRERDRQQSCQLSKSIYIGNLPYSVTADQLRDAFLAFGKVLNAQIARDEKGGSKGYGLIKFESSLNAENAIKAMDQAKFNGRQVTVRFDRAD
eukprot:403338343